MNGGLAQLNFRDLGGLPVAGGLQVRHGHLYRCQGPRNFANAAREQLQALGIRLVCDLRSAAERALATHDWGLAVALLNCELPNDFADRSSLGLRILLDSPNVEGAKSAMRASYAAMPATIQPHLATIVEAISAGGVPVLIHCSAGKDRTGVLVALLLQFIGVPRSPVIRDYLRSGVFGDRLRSKGPLAEAFGAMYGTTVDEAVVAAIVGVDTEYLVAALDAVDSAWGSVEEYFAAANVDRRWRETLRATLTEAAPASGL